MLLHGGDIAGYIAEYGQMPLDFSANVSPLGLPASVRQAIIESLDRADEYPDPLCRALRAAIAAHEHCDAAHIFCGAGAADLIFRLVLARKPASALVLAPTFQEYETALRLTDCRIRHHILREEEDFRLTARLLDDLHSNPQIIFLCQPNNPTGQPVARELAEQVLRHCEQTGALLVMDECFVDLLGDPAQYTMRGQLASQNLLILKAFTKTYAMAGIRLGYCLSANTALLQQMAACGQPWGVSSAAQAAGIAALQETKYLQTLRALVATERPRLIGGLKSLGLRVMGSQANFVFFAAPPTLSDSLRQRGILIRSCANYEGLGAGYFRVAVRTGAENEILLSAIGQVLEV